MAPLTFDHPILSSIDDDDRLTIRSANRGKMTIPLEKVQRVDVSQFDRGRTTVAVSLLSLVLGGLLAVVVVKSTQ
jgi:hypothetical protein